MERGRVLEAVDEMLQATSYKLVLFKMMTWVNHRNLR
jgi:hypothetical protein